MMRNETKIAEQLAHQFGDYSIPITVDYERALKQLDATKEKIAELEFTKELYEDKIVSCLRQFHFYYVMFNSETFRNIWLKTTGQYNPENHEGADFDLETSLQMIKEKIFSSKHIKKATFKKCLSYSYGWLYEFEYDIYGETVRFSFPMYDNATRENYIELRYRADYYESEYSIRLITSNLRREPVFDEFNKWLDNKAKEYKKKKTPTL